MIDQKKSRRQKLEEYVAQNPKDAFSRYGLALEFLKEGDKAGAEAQFRTLIENHADYVPGFQMYAQMLAQDERRAEARSILTAGIAAATRVGNTHARSEMEGLLAELEAG
jgi:predicted Zn-dependent protease